MTLIQFCASGMWYVWWCMCRWQIFQKNHVMQSCQQRAESKKKKKGFWSLVEPAIPKKWAGLVTRRGPTHNKHYFPYMDRKFCRQNCLFIKMGTNAGSELWGSANYLIRCCIRCMFLNRKWWINHETVPVCNHWLTTEVKLICFGQSLHDTR